MRRILNVSLDRQRELARVFTWLHGVHENSKDIAQILSVSVFDHWLTREEANTLLEGVSPQEQQRRNSLHAAFCSRLASETEVLSFTFRRRKKDRLVFRRFASPATLSSYLRPNGGGTLGHRQFHVVLPQLGCAYYESWDDTNHFYFSVNTDMSLVSQLANECGLHVLKSD
jgi:hypothetical protein